LVAGPTLTHVDMMTASMITVVFFLASGCISPRGVRQSVDWSVLLVIGCALGLASALQASGAADIIGQLLWAISQALVSPSLQPIVVLASLYILAVVCASLLTNAAAAALVFPIALEVANIAEMNPRPLAIAVALASSAAFATPLGSNALLLVSGPGGYRYRDFLRIGLPLNGLCLAVTLLILPWVWPLTSVP
jgi:di/tricarboxylate transporter